MRKKVTSRRSKNNQRSRRGHRAKQAASIDQIEVYSAHQLDKKTVERIKSIFGKDKKVQTIIDPGLIGGVVIRTKDHLFDGSIAGQLKRLKQHIIH